MSTLVHTRKHPGASVCVRIMIRPYLNTLTFVRDDAVDPSHTLKHSMYRRTQMTQKIYYPDWMEIVTYSDIGPQPYVLVESDSYM